MMTQNTHTEYADAVQLLTSFVEAHEFLDAANFAGVARRQEAARIYLSLLCTEAQKLVNSAGIGDQSPQDNNSATPNAA